MSVALSVSHVSKQYQLGDGPSAGSLRELTSAVARRAISWRWRREAPADRESRSIWALKDVSFDVAKGEVIGVIGRNGAGKSTLLKILSRITEPTSGRAEIRGRVASLLEVGTGFHPDLTGRENVFLNGAILGMRKDEIRQRFDEIVAFAEIDQFIDTPVKRYSSGMYVRLAFAVAAHLQPEILLVDEVLAVGDLGFQRKCLGKLNDVSAAGRTVLFVSHNMGAIRSLCSRCVLLERGTVLIDADPAAAVERYVRDNSGSTNSGEVSMDRRPGVPVQVLRLWLEDTEGARVSSVEIGTDVSLLVEYVVEREMRDVTIAVLLGTADTPLLYSYDAEADSSLRRPRQAGFYRARVRLPLSHFKEGTYQAAAKIGCGKEELTDPAAVVTVEVQNTSRDYTHSSYHRQRPGHLTSPMHWEVARVEKGVR